MWELDYKESWVLKNWCFWTVVLEKTLESFWTARRSNQSILKEISPECSLWGRCWSWNSNTLATWCKELTHLKRPWCWERLKARGEGDDRRWDGWMASPTQRTWVRVNSGSWWWTGKPGVLQSMGRKKSDMTERLNWTDLMVHFELTCVYLWGEVQASFFFFLFSYLVVLETYVENPTCFSLNWLRNSVGKQLAIQMWLSWTLHCITLAITHPYIDTAGQWLLPLQ